MLTDEKTQMPIGDALGCGTRTKPMPAITSNVVGLVFAPRSAPSLPVVVSPATALVMLIAARPGERVYVPRSAATCDADRQVATVQPAVQIASFEAHAFEAASKSIGPPSASPPSLLFGPPSSFGRSPSGDAELAGVAASG